MTQEEEIQFKVEVVKAIMPYAKNMNHKQIKDIINLVSKENKDLPKGFANMIFEQILILKYNK